MGFPQWHSHISHFLGRIRTTRRKELRGASIVNRSAVAVCPLHALCSFLWFRFSCLFLCCTRRMIGRACVTPVNYSIRWWITFSNRRCQFVNHPIVNVCLLDGERKGSLKMAFISTTRQQCWTRSIPRKSSIAFFRIHSSHCQHPLTMQFPSIKGMPTDRICWMEFQQRSYLPHVITGIFSLNDIAPPPPQIRLASQSKIAIKLSFNIDVASTGFLLRHHAFPPTTNWRFQRKINQLIVYSSKSFCCHSHKHIHTNTHASLLSPIANRVKDDVVEFVDKNTFEIFTKVFWGFLWRFASLPHPFPLQSSVQFA